MTINERVRQVRNKLSLTQKIFGVKLAVSQNYLSQIENGEKDVTEKILRLICFEFNVNEDWLRNGVGEMFVETDESIISEIANEYHLDGVEKSILTYFLKLSPEKRKLFKSFAYMLTDMVLDDDRIYMDYQSEKPQLVELVGRNGRTTVEITKEIKESMKNAPNRADDPMFD